MKWWPFTKRRKNFFTDRDDHKLCLEIIGDAKIMVKKLQDECPQDNCVAIEALAFYINELNSIIKQQGEKI